MNSSGPYSFIVPQTQLVEEAPYQEQRPQEADSSHVEANSSYGQTTQPRRLCKFGPSCTRAQCYFYHPEREVYGFGGQQMSQGYAQPLQQTHFTPQPHYNHMSNPQVRAMPQMNPYMMMAASQMYGAPAAQMMAAQSIPPQAQQMMMNQHHMMGGHGQHNGGQKMGPQGFPPNRKTKLCHHFEKTGSCPYSNGCFFAHGPQELVELPKKGPNRMNFNGGGSPNGQMHQMNQMNGGMDKKQ